MILSCPFCGFGFEDDGMTSHERGLREKEHMEAAHSEIIEERLTDAGFERGPNGEWVDTLAHDG